MSRTKKDIMDGILKDHGSRVVQDIKEFNPRKIANNTVEFYIKVSEMEDFIRIIRLHDTDILVFHPSGAVQLDSGGWLTMTTRNRMNKYGADHRFSIYQDKRIWYVSLDTRHDVPRAERIRYFDGIRIKNGKILNPREKDDPVFVEQARLEKLINKYCDKLGKVISREGIPSPQRYDCWHCLAETQLDPELAKVKHGVLTPSGFTETEWLSTRDCLVSHLEDRYVHGSLIYNSLKARGYRDPAFIFKYGSSSMIRRAVRWYFRQRLGLPR